MLASLGVVVYIPNIQEVQQLSKFVTLSYGKHDVT